MGGSFNFHLPQCLHFQDTLNQRLIAIRPCYSCGLLDDINENRNLMFYKSELDSVGITRYKSRYMLSWPDIKRNQT